ncbi:phosphatidylinositol-specific phospholipase C domain-containing protein [Bacterioplanoides sp. SCSIO 12839]|uniref:phosphatidylinositol-specific phospholipase C domain-containing protein n=1 Tax=Bacterioplanoides sp. SCSIO 12839 TaxID=2829569 RepID=UPI002103678D|nr:phosphatidylinositol-specific phospholipase C domain-containing protein [Bacterioplanoides sp. SCSIO 12839]UTW46817.1 phosphatidylinositol-specific phospholipase C domain-containing protein [Bacterioplanoides sp. SCSIO 12839]
MKKIITSTLLSLVLSMPAIVSAHDDGAYYHGDGAVAHHPSWMQRLSDDTRLNKMSLVGSHDTLSFHGGDIVQTQSMSLKDQLESGIRVLDIRNRHINNKFAIHHGIVFQHAWFGEDVLKPVVEFLKANPSETILMNIQPAHTEKDNTRKFEETLDQYAADYNAPFWTPTSLNPTLSEIRGKIVMLYKHFTPRNVRGIHQSQLSGGVPDYTMDNNWELHEQWQGVKARFEAADNGNHAVIYNHGLNASGGSFPYFVASGHSSPGTSAPRLATGLTTPGWKDSYPDFPRVNCFIGICTIAFEGLNTLAADYIQNGNIQSRALGLVWSDFPGKRLIENVINLNVPEYRMLVDQRSGLCLDVKYAQTHNGNDVWLWPCDGNAAQLWAYDASSGYVKSKLGKCLDNRGQTYSDGTVGIWDCVDSNNLRFDLVGNTLRSRNDNNIVLDAMSTEQGGRVGQWQHHGGANQQWLWRE